ncbi:hypothetical protein [Myxosarcina sp. GI1(2024)]
MLSGDTPDPETLVKGKYTAAGRIYVVAIADYIFPALPYDFATLPH